jgi:CBS domain-containing protein
MRTDLVTIPASTPLSEVERMLSESRVNGAPVVEASGAIVGVVSMRDLLDRYTEDPDSRPRRSPSFFHLTTEELVDEDFEDFEGPDASEDTAADVMTAEVFTIDADADLREVARAMTRHGVHRLLVTEGGRYVGIVSTTDVLAALGS